MFLKASDLKTNILIFDNSNFQYCMMKKSGSQTACCRQGVQGDVVFFGGFFFDRGV